MSSSSTNVLGKRRDRDSEDDSEGGEDSRRRIGAAQEMIDVLDLSEADQVAAITGPIEIGQEPSASMLRILEILPIRTLLELCASRPATALRLCGVPYADSVTDEVEVPDGDILYQHWLTRLAQEFGINAVPALGGAPASPLREMVAASLALYAGLPTGSSAMSNRQRSYKLRNLYLRIVNSVAKPIEFYALSSRTTRVTVVHYMHGGAVVLQIERVEPSALQGSQPLRRTLFVVCSVVSIVAARADLDGLLTGAYGPLYRLTETYYGGDIDFASTDEPGVYRSNVPRDGPISAYGNAAIQQLDIVYAFLNSANDAAVAVPPREDALLPDGGLFVFRVSEVLAQWRESVIGTDLASTNPNVARTQDGTGLLIDSRAVASINRQRTARSALFHVTGIQSSVLVRTHDWDIPEGPMGGAEYLNYLHTENAVFSRALPRELKNDDQTETRVANDFVLVQYQPLGSRAQRRWRLVHDAIIAAGYTASSGEAAASHTRFVRGTYVATRDGSRANRLLVVLREPSEPDSAARTKFAVVRVDCTLAGEPRVAMIYSGSLETRIAHVGSLIDDEVLAMHLAVDRRARASTQLLLLNVVSGELWRAYPATRYAWLMGHRLDTYRQSPLELSVLELDFDTYGGTTRQMHPAEFGAQRLVAQVWRFEED